MEEMIPELRSEERPRGAAQCQCAQRACMSPWSVSSNTRTQARMIQRNWDLRKEGEDLVKGLLGRNCCRNTEFKGGGWRLKLLNLISANVRGKSRRNSGHQMIKNVQVCLVVLGIDPRTLRMQSMSSATELRATTATPCSEVVLLCFELAAVKSH